MNRKIVRALKEVALLLYGHKVKWLVVGSTSLALQGVDVEPEDIDIICSKEDAFEIGRILKKYETQSVVFGRTHCLNHTWGSIRFMVLRSKSWAISKRKEARSGSL
ncbi:MAG: nucleotidyltransferase domain-containing protein [Promethearchaeati archaeon]